MKPPPFTYARPADRTEVDDLVARHGADCRLLAGGQTLVPGLCRREVRPALVVDLNHLRDEPARPELSGRTLSFGPLVRLTALGADTAVRHALPVLANLLGRVGTPAVRNRATVIGNLVAADRHSELPALLGLLGGHVVVRTAAGRRRVDLLAATTGWALGGPDRTSWVDEVTVRLPDPGTRLAFTEVSRRFGSRAVAGAVAAAAPVAGGRTRLGTAVFGASPAPVHLDLGVVDDAELAAPEGHAPWEHRLAGLLAPRLDDLDDAHGTGRYRALVAPRLAARALRVAADDLRLGGNA